MIIYWPNMFTYSVALVDFFECVTVVGRPGCSSWTLVSSLSQYLSRFQYLLRFEVRFLDTISWSVHKSAVVKLTFDWCGWRRTPENIPLAWINVLMQNATSMFLLTVVCGGVCIFSYFRNPTRVRHLNFSRLGSTRISKNQKKPPCNIGYISVDHHLYTRTQMSYVTFFATRTRVA